MAVVTVSGVAIAWPKFTSQPRPDPLTRVNDIVKNTPVGKNIAKVLGISDDMSTEPINIASVASSLTERIAQTVQDRASHIVVTQAVRQLAWQIDKLSAGDRQQVQELLCKPEASSSSQAQ